MGDTKDPILESLPARSQDSAREPAFSLAPSSGPQVSTAGNQAMQRLFTPAAQNVCLPGDALPQPVPETVTIEWNAYTPWVFSVQGSHSKAAMSMELYGFDITATNPAALPVFQVFGKTQYASEPELLRPSYQLRFHEQMLQQVYEDARKLEDHIYEDEDVDEGMEILESWARRSAFRGQSGRTYFDILLTHLRDNYWYRDYLVTTGKKHTYYDSLYDWAGGRAGRVSTLIAQNSVEYGASRPTWLFAETALGPRTKEGKPADGPKVNKEFVENSADLVLEKLEGITSAKDSHAIVDTLCGMPGPEQSMVLKEIMSRYDERTWYGLGKYGEASEGNMLYWLFEDLTGDDKDKLKDSLVNNRILTEDQAATLVEGRGIISRTLPWTTGKLGQMAEERVKYWADEANKGSLMAYVWGPMDALFLPQNIDATVMTIMAPGALKGIAAVSEPIAFGLGIIGVGHMIDDSVVAVQKLTSGVDPKTGRKLDSGEMLASALTLGSNILFAVAGGLEVRKSLASGRAGVSTGEPIEPSVKLSGARALPETLSLTPGGVENAPALPQARPTTQWRVVDFNGESGDMTAVGRSGDDYVIVRINSQTLNGEMIHPRSGETLPIRNGIPVRNNLLPEFTGATAPVEEVASPGSEPAEKAPAKITGPAPAKQLAPPMSAAEQSAHIERLLAQQKKLQGNIDTALANQERAGDAAYPLEELKSEGGLSKRQQGELDAANAKFEAARKAENSLKAELAKNEAELANIRQRTVQPTTWQEHETIVAERAKADHPGARVGEQVALDVTNVTTGETVRINTDVSVFENGQLQIIDAKFSEGKDLTTGKLDVYQPNQTQAYAWISNGDPVTVVPQGANAAEMGLTPGQAVKVVPNVEVHVNSPEGIRVRNYKDTR